MSDLTTEGVMLGLCGPDYAGGPYDYDLESRFKVWLSELIRKEREEAWDECLSEMPLDLDWKLQYGDQNPYRKE